mgnify:CR=1 FL=1
MPEFDLFLFTSNNEPTGGVLLESYACRVPIVAANAGGIPEVVKDNETGLLAEVGNPIDFADKVILLLDNETLQKQFTDNGYQFLKDNFTKEVIAKKMFDELNEVLIKSQNWFLKEIQPNLNFLYVKNISCWLKLIEKSK